MIYLKEANIEDAKEEYEMISYMPADENGVRIATLDEMSYRRKLWNHRPLTDFWRVGGGYAKKLERYGMYTMGDIARCSVGEDSDYYNEELLYKLFGVNAELLIDHAWGYEPCTIAEVKAYRPESNSLSQGQVLQSPYEHEKARVIVKEMSELLALDLVEKHLVTNQLVLTIGYDVENLKDPDRRKAYRGEIVMDRYGRQIPKHGHGTKNLPYYTSSSKMIIEKMTELFEEITDPSLLVRRVTVVANTVVSEKKAQNAEKNSYRQLTIFDSPEDEQEEKERKLLDEKEHSLQEAMLKIKRKYGKNAILRGTNFEEGAMTIERNAQVGGHKA